VLKALEDISATKKRLKIEIPAEAVESEIQKALTDVQRKTSLPGFRPGRAPLSLIEKKFGKNVEAEVLERMVPEYYAMALRERDLKPVSGPVVEENFDFKRNTSLALTVTVEVRPQVEPLRYDDLTVREIPVEAADDEVTKVIRNLAEERASYEPVESPIQEGDLVTIDYDTGDSETSACDAVVKMGSGPYPEEFFSGLTGRSKEDSVRIAATFPEDSPTPFAGKRQDFTVTVKEVKRRTLPDIDDEFAKDLGTDNLEALKEKVRDRLLASKTREADRMKQKELLDGLVESHTFEIPESLLETELSGVIGEVLASGRENRSEEVLREEFKPVVERNIRGSIILEIIGEREGITVSEEELRNEILGLAQAFQMPPENVIKYYTARDGSLERMKRNIFERKVLAFLLSKATTTEGAAS
jgi:trigger factor